MTGFLLWFVFLFFLLQDFIKQLSNSTAGNYLPEFLVIVVFAWGVILQLVKHRSVSPLIFLTIFLYSYFVGISLIFGQQKSVFAVLAQSFIHIEYFLLAAGFCAIIICRKPSFQKILLGLLAVTLIGALFNALLGNAFFSLLHVKTNLESLRLGRLSGLQLNANRVGVMLALGVTYLMVLARDKPKEAKWFYGFVAIITIFVCFTASRTALGIIFLAFVFTIRPRRMPVQLIFIILCLSAVFLTQTQVFSLIYQKTQANFSQLANGADTTYARWLMLGGGLNLALQHFPIGAGAATFGSTLSPGSGVYAQLGLLAYE
ncbi:MAG: hypothetical protein ACREGF_03205, partial [Candidatus Saccharimonadales bacterium]